MPVGGLQALTSWLPGGRSLSHLLVILQTAFGWLDSNRASAVMRASLLISLCQKPHNYTAVKG